ncbi:signal peptidase II [bacterium]|jgi:signal peptidase II|nr:signal peptidase II [bacterium]
MFGPLYSTAIFLLVLSDQISKMIAENFLSTVSLKPILPFINFVLVHNYGAAYGIFQNQKVFLIIVSSLVIFFCFYFRHSLAPSKLSRIGLSFLIAGAIGNLIDRCVYGYVIDFIHTPLVPVFNFADAFIDIGIVFLLIDLFYSKEKQND